MHRQPVMTNIESHRNAWNGKKIVYYLIYPFFIDFIFIGTLVTNPCFCINSRSLSVFFYIEAKTSKRIDDMVHCIVHWLSYKRESVTIGNLNEFEC